MSVESPFEFWDPADGSEITIEPIKYEEGSSTFTPNGRLTKTVPVIRIWVDKNPPRPAPLNYWDFSGSRVRARLLPLIAGIIQKKARLTLVRRGTGVLTDYEIRLG